MDPNDLINFSGNVALPDDVRQSIRPFLSSDFDPQNFSREVLQQSAIPLAEHLSLIDSSIAVLDSVLKNSVLDDHEALTANVSLIGTLTEALSDLHGSADSLLQSTGKTLDSFRKIYEDYSNQLLEYERAVSVSDLLRKATRLRNYAKRLRSLLGNPIQFAKAATVISELNFLHEDAELQKIHVILEDLRFVQNTVERLPYQMSETLQLVVHQQDLSAVADIVDASLVLGVAIKLLDEVTAGFLRLVDTQIQDGLSMQLIAQSDAGKNAARLPGRTTLPSVQTSPAIRAAFWTKLDEIFDIIYQTQMKMELLESVYVKRYDEYSLYSIDVPPIEAGCISTEFFTKCAELLKTGLEKCGNESSFLQQTLENEYPRLLKILKDVMNRLKNGSLFLDFSVEKEMNVGVAASFRRSISSYQELFVLRSLSRLLDPVNLCLSDPSSVPSVEDVHNIVRAVTNELLVCSVDDVLGIFMCKNVAKALKTTFIKLDELVTNNGESTQVIGGLTAKQEKNFKIIKASIYLKEKLQYVLENSNVVASREGNAVIMDAVASHEAVVQSVMEPLMSSLLDSIEAVFLTMHQEDFSSEGDEGDESIEMPCSMYMRELQDLLSRTQHTFIAILDIKKPLIRSYVVDFAQRCLDLFIRHTSLIRPVGKSGRLRLAADFAQMEAALAPLDIHSSEYGAPFQVLKAMRPLLFQTPEQISQSSVLGTIVPYSVVLHHLFSRAPTDLQSPYQSSGWSISRYSRYLDEHRSENERLTILKASLDNYAHSVRNRGETHYAVIYPLMREMLNQGFDTVHSKG